MPKKTAKTEKEDLNEPILTNPRGEVMVLIHPMARGYNRRATDDWKNGKVKKQGNILLPDGQEARPAGAYRTTMCDELEDMMKNSVIVAGSKVMITPKLQ